MKQLETIAAKRAELLKEYRSIVQETEEARTKVVNQIDQYITQAEESLKGKGTFVYHAKDAEEARKLILELCADKLKLVRFANPELDEIEFDDLMVEAGKEVALTDVGEIVIRQIGKEGNKHPMLFNLEGLNQEDIIKALQNYVGAVIENPQELNRAVQKKIREGILASDYGVTNVQGIVAQNGTIVIGESEGNGRTASNLPYRHIVVAGYDRLYDTAEETLRGIQTANIYGLGKESPTYYSLISGQSRTADIEFNMAYGVHGPLEVHLILLDNSRKELQKRGCGDLLKCIDCGACYNSFYALAEQNGWKNTILTAKFVGLQAVNGKLKAEHGLESLTDFDCPVGITADIVKKAF